MPDSTLAEAPPIGGVVFECERIGAPGLWDELLPLFLAHKREVGEFQDLELRPSEATYERMDDLGFLRLFTMRAKSDGRLIGYSSYFVAKNPHYAACKQATQDVIYVLPELRGTGAGARLICYADGYLAREGVRVIYRGVRVGHDFGPVLERLGYERAEVHYSRRLDR